MQSLLKRETVRIESLGRDLELQELSAKAISEINDEYRKDSFRGGLTVCRYGVVEWQNENVDDMLPCVPMRVVDEVVRQVYRLSGIDVEADAKNLDGAPSGGSSSV